MKTNHSEVNFLHVAQVVHPSSQFILIVFDPAMVPGNGISILLTEENVFQTRGSFNSATSVVLTQPDLIQVLLEDTNVSISIS